MPSHCIKLIHCVAHQNELKKARVANSDWCSQMTPKLLAASCWLDVYGYLDIVTTTWYVCRWWYYMSFLCVKSKQLSKQTDVFLHLFLHLLCFLSQAQCVILNLKCFVVPSFPFPPSLRFSYSPVTLISMCPEQYEWVFTPPEKCTPSPDWNAFKTAPPFLPFFSPRTDPHNPSPTYSLQLSHDCTACCLTTRLPTWSTGWTCDQKTCLTISSPSSLCQSIQLVLSCSSQPGCQEPCSCSVDHPSLLFLSRIIGFVSRKLLQGAIRLWLNECVCMYLWISVLMRLFEHTRSHSSPLPIHFQAVPVTSALSWWHPLQDRAICQQVCIAVCSHHFIFSSTYTVAYKVYFFYYEQLSKWWTNWHKVYSWGWNILPSLLNKFQHLRKKVWDISCYGISIHHQDKPRVVNISAL